jgi:membrane glycosyltransferase
VDLSMDGVIRPAAVADAIGSLPQRPLPPDAPLAMPMQSLQDRPIQMTDRADATSIGWRRRLVMLATATMSCAGIYEMYLVLQVGSVTVLEGMVLALFAALFAWVALSFVSALAGFAALLSGWRDDLGAAAEGPLPAISSRTAMLLPIYNEEPQSVFARLQAARESVEATGYGALFDWFILSDSTDPNVWIAEEKCYLVLAAEGQRLFYRHRRDNHARKSGNIEDWVKRFGADYSCMVILDADSVMTGDALVRLAAAMERHPCVGLIQTLPLVVNARTLFARLQQFAGRMYGPVIGAGIAWRHSSDGNYWGHNAIIRIEAFAASAGLPWLPGRNPFGGTILSHDFVEAAFLRRAGWRIHMAPTLRGSYEECPPSLLDFAARDRRWCQGNLQHAKLLQARGLHWVSRMHLLTGIGSYVTAPLWLAFLVAGILVSLQAQFVRPEYFPKGYSLFPHWPAQDPVRAAWVFAGTMGLLVLPKLLALLLILFRPETRRSFGGGWRATGGLVVETLISGLTAPVMMVFQSKAIAEILVGRDAGWNVQHRGDGTIALRELARRYAIPSWLGVGMASAALLVSWPLFLWMTPIIFGLVLAIPVALLTSSIPLKRHTAAILATPEEIIEPPILSRAKELGTRLSHAVVVGDPLLELRNSATLRELHLAGLARQPLRQRGRIDPTLALARARIDDADCITEVVQWLDKPEKQAVLNDGETLRRVMLMPRVD